MFFLRRKCLAIRFIAVVVVGIFLFEETLKAQSFSGAPTPLPAVYDLETLKISDHLGSVKEIFLQQEKAGASPAVIQIQDSHANKEAQTQIAKILQQVTNSPSFEGIDSVLIAVEGAAGPLSPKEFFGHPDKKIEAQLTEIFLDEGKIAGSELFALNARKKIELFGIEDRQLYTQNLQVFQQAHAIKEKYLPQVKEIKKAVSQLQAFIYPKPLLDLVMAHQHYTDGDLSFKDYLQLLAKNQFSLAHYPQSAQALEVFALEEKIDFKKVDKERRYFFKELENRLVGEEREHFIEKTFLFRLGQSSSLEYYRYLRQLVARQFMAPQAVLERYPNLFLYIDSLEEHAGIDGPLLYAEVEALTQELKQAWFTDLAVAELDQLDASLALLLKLLSLEMTREELQLLKKKPFVLSDWQTQLDTAAWEKPQVKKEVAALQQELQALSKLFEELPLFEQFYQLALKRDHALSNNLMKLIAARKTQLVFLIAGGFHTDGIKQILAEKGISYAVISPRLVRAVDPSIYLQRMLNLHTPFERALQRTGNRLGVELLSAQIMITPQGTKKQEWLIEEKKFLSSSSFKNTALSIPTSSSDIRKPDERESQLLKEVINDLRVFLSDKLGVQSSEFQYIKNKLDQIEFFVSSNKNARSANHIPKEYLKISGRYEVGQKYFLKIILRGKFSLLREEHIPSEHQKNVLQIQEQMEEYFSFDRDQKNKIEKFLEDFPEEKHYFDFFKLLSKKADGDFSEFDKKLHGERHKPWSSASLLDKRTFLKPYASSFLFEHFPESRKSFVDPVIVARNLFFLFEHDFKEEKFYPFLVEKNGLMKLDQENPLSEETRIKFEIKKEGETLRLLPMPGTLICWKEKKNSFLSGDTQDISESTKPPSSNIAVSSSPPTTFFLNGQWQEPLTDSPKTEADALNGLQQILGSSNHNMETKIDEKPTQLVSEEVLEEALKVSSREETRDLKETQRLIRKEDQKTKDQQTTKDILFTELEPSISEKGQANIHETIYWFNYIQSNLQSFEEVQAILDSSTSPLHDQVRAILSFPLRTVDQQTAFLNQAQLLLKNQNSKVPLPSQQLLRQVFFTTAARKPVIVQQLVRALDNTENSSALLDVEEEEAVEIPAELTFSEEMSKLIRIIKAYPITESVWQKLFISQVLAFAQLPFRRIKEENYETIREALTDKLEKIKSDDASIQQQLEQAKQALVMTTRDEKIMRNSKNPVSNISLAGDFILLRKGDLFEIGKDHFYLVVSLSSQKIRFLELVLGTARAIECNLEENPVIYMGVGPETKNYIHVSLEEGVQQVDDKDASAYLKISAAKAANYPQIAMLKGKKEIEVKIFVSPSLPEYEELSPEEAKNMLEQTVSSGAETEEQPTVLDFKIPVPEQKETPKTPSFKSKTIDPRNLILEDLNLLNKFLPELNPELALLNQAVTELFQAQILNSQNEKLKKQFLALVLALYVSNERALHKGIEIIFSNEKMNYELTPKMLVYMAQVHNQEEEKFQERIGSLTKTYLNQKSPDENIVEFSELNEKIVSLSSIIENIRLLLGDDFKKDQSSLIVIDLFGKMDSEVLTEETPADLKLTYVESENKYRFELSNSLTPIQDEVLKITNAQINSLLKSESDQILAEAIVEEFENSKSKLVKKKTILLQKVINEDEQKTMLLHPEQIQNLPPSEDDILLPQQHEAPKEINRSEEVALEFDSFDHPFEFFVFNEKTDWQLFEPEWLPETLFVAAPSELSLLGPDFEPPVPGEELQAFDNRKQIYALLVSSLNRRIEKLATDEELRKVGLEIIELALEKSNIPDDEKASLRQLLSSPNVSLNKMNEALAIIEKEPKRETAKAEEIKAVKVSRHRQYLMGSFFVALAVSAIIWVSGFFLKRKGVEPDVKPVAENLKEETKEQTKEEIKKEEETKKETKTVELDLVALLEEAKLKALSPVHARLEAEFVLLLVQKFQEIKEFYLEIRRSPKEAYEKMLARFVKQPQLENEIEFLLFQFYLERIDSIRRIAGNAYFKENPEGSQSSVLLEVAKYLSEIEKIKEEASFQEWFEKEGSLTLSNKLLNVSLQNLKAKLEKIALLLNEVGVSSKPEVESSLKLKCADLSQQVKGALVFKSIVERAQPALKSFEKEKTEELITAIKDFLKENEGAKWLDAGNALTLKLLQKQFLLMIENKKKEKTGEKKTSQQSTPSRDFLATLPGGSGNDDLPLLKEYLKTIYSLYEAKGEGASLKGLLQPVISRLPAEGSLEERESSEKIQKWMGGEYSEETLRWLSFSELKKLSDYYEAHASSDQKQQLQQLSQAWKRFLDAKKRIGFTRPNPLDCLEPPPQINAVETAA